jgi:hypothetical protein
MGSQEIQKEQSPKQFLHSLQHAYKYMTPQVFHGGRFLSFGSHQLSTDLGIGGRNPGQPLACSRRFASYQEGPSHLRTELSR